MERVPTPPSQPRPKVSPKNRLLHSKRLSFEDSSDDSDAGGRIIQGYRSSSFSSKSRGCSLASGTDTCCASSPQSKSGKLGSSIDPAIAFQSLPLDFPFRRARREIDARNGHLPRKVKNENRLTTENSAFHGMRNCLQKSLLYIREMERHLDSVETELKFVTSKTAPCVATPCGECTLHSEEERREQWRRERKDHQQRLLEFVAAHHNAISGPLQDEVDRRRRQVAMLDASLLATREENWMLHSRLRRMQESSAPAIVPPFF